MECVCMCISPLWHKTTTDKVLIRDRTQKILQNACQIISNSFKIGCRTSMHVVTGRGSIRITEIRNLK